MESHCVKRTEEPMTIPESKRQRTSSHSSNEGMVTLFKRVVQCLNLIRIYDIKKK